MKLKKYMKNSKILWALAMARHGSQQQISSDASGLRSSSGFHSRQVTPQPSRSGLRTAASLPSSPQPTTSLRMQAMTTSPTRHTGYYATSPPSTSTSSSSSPSTKTSSRSGPPTPWDESQQRRMGRVTSFSTAKEPTYPLAPKRTHSEESQSSQRTQPQFHLRHRLKIALKDFFKRDSVDEEYECEKIQDSHWTDWPGFIMSNLKNLIRSGWWATWPTTQTTHYCNWRHLPKTIFLLYTQFCFSLFILVFWWCGEKQEDLGNFCGGLDWK